MSRAVASVNTADFEGMPNVLLEGWSRGVPALVLRHDPGGVISAYGLGAFAHGSREGLVSLAREQWRTRHAREELSPNAVGPTSRSTTHLKSSRTMDACDRFSGERWLTVGAATSEVELDVCGIVGKIDFAGRVEPTLLEAMCAAIAHRGPDARGIWCDGGVGLAMQRLAIIDVAGGDQPIFNEDRTVAVVMNGEIYNFQELRAELIAKGHRFATLSDTEVLVHLYEEHGDALVDRLRGMFAFAIWDARASSYCWPEIGSARSRCSLSQRQSVWFASEIMALLQDPEIEREPNPQAIADYLAYQYVPHPMSAFAGIEKLPPASTLTVTPTGKTHGDIGQLDYGVPEPAEPRRSLKSGCAS